MIALRYQSKYLDIERGSIGFDLKNPLFDKSGIPGSISYPFKLSGKSKVNSTLMKFSRLPGVTDRVETLENIQLYLEKILWKIGKLDLLGGQTDFDVNFRGDAADLSEIFSNTKLAELDLGEEARDMTVVNDVYPNVTHTYFPVLNPDFYGDKNTDFKGYINYYHGGAFLTNSTTNDYAIVPFVYMCHVIEKIFELHGWYVEGNFLDDPDIQRLVIYNNYALDALSGGLNQYADTITLANHMPDLTIGQFLVGIKNLFGLGYFFEPKTKTVTIRTWQEVLADQTYRNWTSKAGKDPQWSVNDYRGINFLQNVKNDKLIEERSFDWQEYRVDGGDEKVESAASPLLEETHTDSINTRTWTTPYVKQTGSSDEFELEYNAPGFRLMFYAGMVNDSAGNPYPAGRIAYGAHSLRWSGGTGLQTKYYGNYTTFKQLTRQETWEIRLKVADLLNLNLAQKKMLDYQKYLVQDVKLSVSDAGIKAAKVTVWKTGL